MLCSKITVFVIFIVTLQIQCEKKSTRENVGSERNGGNDEKSQIEVKDLNNKKPNEILGQMDESLKNEIVMDVLKNNFYNDPQLPEKDEDKNQKSDQTTDEPHKDEKNFEQTNDGGLDDDFENEEITDQDEISDDDEIVEDEKYIEAKLRRIAKKDPVWFFSRRRAYRRRRRIIQAVTKKIGKGYRKMASSWSSWYRRVRLKGR